MGHFECGGKSCLEPSYEVQEGEITPGTIFWFLPFLGRSNLVKAIIRNMKCVLGKRADKRVIGVCCDFVIKVDGMWFALIDMKKERRDSADLPKLAFAMIVV